MATNICLVVTDARSLNILYRDQLEYLNQCGFNLTLICGGSSVELQRLRERDVGRIISIGFVRRPAPLIDAISLLKLIFHFLFNRYDLVLSTTPKAILLGSIASWITLQRNRIVFFQGRVYENSRGLNKKFFALLDRISNKISTHSLFVSSSLLAAYEAEGLVKHGRGKIIGSGSVNGVDTEIFSSERFTKDELSTLKSSLQIPDNYFIAVTVGRICKDKGLEDLKKIADNFIDREIAFIVIGSVEVGYENTASIIFSTPNIKHIPFTLDVAKYFNIADVHLFLTHREGFGNVAVEAASCGLPTIAFDVIGVKDSVAHGLSGIRIPFGRISEVTTTIEQAIEDRKIFRHRFSRSRLWAEATYSKLHVWENYSKFLKSVD